MTIMHNVIYPEVVCVDPYYQQQKDSTGSVDFSDCESICRVSYP